ncbi:ABC-F family ATP-binding cassette domain-containing protein [Paenibacillus cineris]|uniref:ABC-F family ATP-binding cassette domain-containing protein n=1 Tax=Paenibacillus cineris TaxID=237530 RepID=UPI001B2E3048|nr:ABC-F family ATP-binding cassette domain-containing protein [Paenibacillus cineris]GIO63147.1 ABC transporter ATP-binding protein [Paenibacillus cineris]
MSILNVTNLTHMYGDQITFRHIEFRLLPGEHAGLVGMNGAGKSTLFRLLTGSLLPEEGRIEWSPRARVGFLEQHISLQEGMTVLRYLERAFQHLFDMEREMNEIAGRFGEAGDGLDAMLRRYGELQDGLEQAGFYAISAKIEDVARGLGLAEIGLDTDVSRLSGGQKTKLLLAKLLLEEPDVLLLDEPTNYLDAVHIEWLTGYLKKYPHAFIVVSHDEHFLNEITNVIFHLAHQTLKRYTGSYAAFQKQYALGQKQQQAAYERQTREIERLESFININRVRKAKQAKSREKMLSRIERVEKPGDGPAPRFEFRAEGNLSGSVLIEAKRLQAGYAVPLFRPLDLTVKGGDKIAIIGENGAGKSTLLKTLLGGINALGGAVTVQNTVRTAYYQQEDTPSSDTPLQYVWSLRPDLTEKEIRRTLAMAGLSAEHIRKPMRTLSGGEQAKARLAELMLTRSNLLVLDEPTNHLDVRAKESLQKALAAYPGTVLLVSHEPAFYEDWVTDIWRVQDWK